MAKLPPDIIKTMIKLREQADQIAKRLRDEGNDTTAKVLERHRDWYDSVIHDPEGQA